MQSISCSHKTGKEIGEKASLPLREGYLAWENIPGSEEGHRRRGGWVGNTEMKRTKVGQVGRKGKHQSVWPVPGRTSARPADRRPPCK